MTEEDANSGGNTEGPNKHPGATAAGDSAALGSSCRYFSQTFAEGETICFQGREWVCSAGAWVATGNAC